MKSIHKKSSNSRDSDHETDNHPDGWQPASDRLSGFHVVSREPLLRRITLRADIGIRLQNLQCYNLNISKKNMKRNKNSLATCKRNTSNFSFVTKILSMEGIIVGRFFLHIWFSLTDETRRKLRKKHEHNHIIVYREMLEHFEGEEDI